jgi:hypothetical protein
MKRQFFSYLAVAVIPLTTALTSCNKPNDDFVGIKLLDTESWYDGLLIRKYLYDDQNRIKEISWISHGTVSEKIIFSYTGEDMTKREDMFFEEGEIITYPTYYVTNGNKVSWSNSLEIIEGDEPGNHNLICTATLNFKTLTMRRTRM